MSEFKIGDVVLIIGEPWALFWRLKEVYGKIGEITKIYPYGHLFQVAISGYTFKWNYEPKSLTKLSAKQVKFIEKLNGNYNN